MTELGVTEDLVEKGAHEVVGEAVNMKRVEDDTWVEGYATDFARAVLAAVVPEVRRMVAEEIAAAIEGHDQAESIWHGQHIRECAKVAREIGGVEQ